ncbi:beta-ketoacyl-ACP synthase [Teredinibacter turnerae]|uniref:beta-ketoacyl-ACP synthase n=1 Tax=Teredinibacter turnerae TaxID=2426 RepID=UPI0004781F0D|nr:beta-ketoacyl-ACP synthase [Teredinibacter turnerae]
MSCKRVVITGMSTITSLGSDWETFRTNALAGKSGIKRMAEWERYGDLNTRLGGPVTDFQTPSHFSRKKTRGMGRVSLMATSSAERALADAGLLGDPILKSGQVGVAYGSSTGSTDAVRDFAGMIIEGNMTSVTATTYIRMMSHTSPVNIGVFFGLRGRLYTTSSACTSGSQAIGQAFETIKAGRQIAMVAGGGEELCPTEAAVFDTLYATSTANDTPELTPRPFDQNRDGLVIGEGAGTLILEEREHAIARGATIYAEVLGYGQNTDGGHITQPNAETMQIAMELALQDAGLSPADIGYVNAHGTATDRGDLAESRATASLFGNRLPMSTLKGHLGHTLGACGAVEAWATIQMMRENLYLPTLNLKTPDPECGELDYIMNEGRGLECEFVMNNNFAFGGINTSLIFRRHSES